MSAPHSAAPDGKTHAMDPVSAGQTGALPVLIQRLLRLRFIWSVGAQGLVSVLHFGLNIVLVRSVELVEFGLYALAFVLAMFGSAVNNALVSTPLTVYTPIIRDEQERAGQERLFAMGNLVLFFGFLMAGMISARALGLPMREALAMVTFVALYSARQFSRSRGYARGRPLVTASGDIVYVISSLLAVAASYWLLGQWNAMAVLLSLAAGQAMAMLTEHLNLSGWRWQWPTLAALHDYPGIWVQTRWALLGALTSLFLAQAHSLIVSAVQGPGAFAPLAAGFVLFGPVRVALLTWQNMVKPELAVALDQGDTERVRRRLRKTTLVTAVTVVALAIALALGWPWVHKLLYARRYADQPMALIVALWAVITLVAASYNAPSAALQALRDFRILAIASLWGALISALLVPSLLLVGSAEWTLLGILAAETFVLIHVARSLSRRLI